jgi:hypothetical protein
MRRGLDMPRSIDLKRPYYNARPVPLFLIDFRYATNLLGTGICDAKPGQGTLGVEGAQLMVPGDPSKSVVSLRMHAVDAFDVEVAGVDDQAHDGFRTMDVEIVQI